ncbi:MAG: hypothetical protein GX610_20820 [Rhodococcus sp.]|nr:hypothetical protein [Rhodococcus sp. (in: high G+C Gram-positive bacteria)]
MRDRAIGALVAAGLPLALLTASPALAQTDPPATETPEFETLCTPTDPRLAELSGLVSSGSTLYAIGDSGSDDAVAVMDRSCAVSEWLTVPVDPYDVEDIAATDTDLWLGDTGDNDRRRDTVALTRMDRETGAGELYRLTYPDGAHDAETLLLQPDGVPLIVTKNVVGASSVYRPVGGTSVDELAQPGPSPLEKVGDIDVSATAEQGAIGSVMFTGGAVSADGTVAAVRSYSDVYLFPVTDGNVGDALVSGEAVRVPLPDQPQGEAVAFTDSGDLLIASEARDGALPPIQILRNATDIVTPGGSEAPGRESEWSTSPVWFGIGLVVLGGVAAAALVGVRRVRRS